MVDICYAQRMCHRPVYSSTCFICVLIYFMVHSFDRLLRALFYYKCMHLSLNWLFLFFRLLVNPKAMTSTSAFLDTFGSFHSFFFDVVGRGEQLCVRNTFEHTFFLKLFKKIFYAFFRPICMLDGELGSFLLCNAV